MSLATRCTACGTIFRVVQDQLRVSEGWVRCGRCAEVFDAREQLFDLDREAPPPWPPAGPEIIADTHRESPFVQEQRPGRAPRTMDAAPPPAPAAATASNRSGTSPAGTYHAPAPAAEPAGFGQPAGLAAGDADHAYVTPDTGGVEAWPDPAEHPGERREPFWEPPPASAAQPDAREHLPEPKGLKFEAPEPAAQQPAPAPAITSPAPAGEPVFTSNPDLGPDVVLSPRLKSAQADASYAPTAPAATSEPPAAATPSRKPGFLRRAEGEARWQRPGVRLALALGSLLLLASAGAQLGWHYRDALATQSPLARQWLGGVCEQLGCQLQPWRRLDAFSVESTGLSEAASGNHYKFSLSLRNKSPWELATPWVELSLNDSSGRLLMKKALKPEDFGNGRPSTAANSEQALQLVFSTGRQRVNGYTVEIFYP